jgi:hypothetical protein
MIVARLRRLPPAIERPEKPHYAGFAAMAQIATP